MINILCGHKGLFTRTVPVTVKFTLMERMGSEPNLSVTIGAGQAIIKTSIKSNYQISLI